ncbi:homoserine dehydrogenase [Peptostreptococcus faecalis]|uniref:homoserine dehydrogenase n=1 Tax=Peptostreptococcus faecalis TaxID=2045015 RepID=UPI000C7ACF15|nr:homoserine dehydrogenase [Peptostreptococcus faecalis]
MKQLKVGIFGFGTVGSGTIEILMTNSEIIEKQAGCPITIKKICVKNMGKKRSFDIDKSMLTDKTSDIIEDPEIDIVVEVMGGIEEARSIIESSFRKGKHVVSANKDLISLYGKELSDLAKENNCHFFYDAAVAGGIPILRSLQFALSGNKINKIGGIINGSTNYILTRMEVEKLSLEEIVEDAKALGFLEEDPSADLEGLDAARKCAILASIGFHSLVTSNQVYVSGINKITLEDIEYADSLGYKIKLLAVAENLDEGIVVRVHPALIEKEHPLASVLYEFNAVYVVGDKVGQTMFYGKGAGALPTGSSVVNDIISVSKNILFENKPELAYDFYENKEVLSLKNLSFSYYMRLLFEHDNNSVSNIIKSLEFYNIPIYSINQWQKEIDGKQYDEFVIITNSCRELNLERAVEEIDMLPNVSLPTRVIRIERGL